MPPKDLRVDDSDLVRRYESGQTGSQIANELGIAASLVYQRLRKLPVTMRHPKPLGRPRWKGIPKESIDAYVSGESENSVAKRNGVSRTVVRCCLKDAGVSIRGQSESESMKWSRMSKRQRRAQTAAAHIAATGRKHSAEEMSKRAITKQAELTFTSPQEFAFLKMLEDAGLDGLTHQRAIGPYNCDIAADTVAVEIFGGNFHFYSNRKARELRRLRYLLNQGWHVIIVHVPNSGQPITRRAAEYVAAYVKASRRNPTFFREYRVIRSDGEFFSGGRSDDKKLTLIPTTKVPRYAPERND